MRPQDEEYEKELDQQEQASLESLQGFSNRELVKMCSGFARENMRLVHWLYTYHKDILRQYEKTFINGQHIEFLE